MAWTSLEAPGAEEALGARSETSRTRIDAGAPRGAIPDAQRVPELDAIRGLAALAVVIYHSKPTRLPWGWAAVDLFFVLSGFLITSIILKHGRSPGFLRNFYARRALRVWPIYYLSIIVVAALSPILPRPFLWTGLPYQLTFTMSVPTYWGADAPWWTMYMGHTWTLMVEEQFYLLWPLLVLMAACGRYRTAALAAVAVVGSVYARSHGMKHILLLGRGDGLALGGLLAAILLSPEFVARRRRELSWSFLAAFTLGAVMLGWVYLTVGVGRWSAAPPSPGITILAFNVVFFGLVGWVACQAGHPGLACLRWKPLRELGLISYGLYLYHMPIIAFSGDLARSFGRRGQPFWREAPTLAACFLVAWASWRWIEEPALRWKRHFRYRAVAVPAVKAPHDIERGTPKSEGAETAALR